MKAWEVEGLLIGKDQGRDRSSNKERAAGFIDEIRQCVEQLCMQYAQMRGIVLHA